MPLSIGGHRWLRLLLLSVIVYLALLPVWWYALDAIASVTAALSHLLYNLLDPQVSIRADAKTVTAYVTATAESGFGGQVHASPLRLDTVTYGLPMIAALVLVTRADSLLSKARALVVGLAAMGLLTVPAVMMWAKMASIELDEQIAEAMLARVGDRSSFFFYAFHGYAFSQPVVAVLVWMSLLMLGLFKRKPKAQVKIIAPSRNDLCPCGSRRKYKRCCGRA